LAEGQSQTEHSTPHRRGGSGRRIAAATAYTGGALTALGALGVGVFVGEVWLARLTIPGAQAPPPRSTGDYGSQYEGAPLQLAVLGDSTAAGYGTRHRDETPGAILATGIAAAAHRPVRLTCPAAVGAVSAWLPAQAETAIEAGVDLAIIFIGANDVTNGGGGRNPVAVRYLHDVVRALRAAGAEVVVATCPDLGTIRPIRWPLRWLARRWSRQLAAAQTVAVVQAGGRTVSLADLLGPQFDAAPDRMFGEDRYHPSIEGYRAAALAVLPSALITLGLLTEAPAVSGPARPLADAALAAAQRPGSEVSAEGLTTRARGRSRWRNPLARRPAAAKRQVPKAAETEDAMTGPDAVPSLSGPAPWEST
jgi:lysophospholipase L1-like esterase